MEKPGRQVLITKRRFLRSDKGRHDPHEREIGDEVKAGESLLNLHYYGDKMESYPARTDCYVIGVRENPVVSTGDQVAFWARVENLVETDGLRLRRAVKEDVERLWEICRGQTAEEFCLWGADLVYEYPPRLEQMRRRFEAFRGRGPVRGGVRGQTVGLRRSGNGPGAKERRAGAGAAGEGAKGKGRGKELVNLVLDQAGKALGLEEVRLIVYSGNLRAQRCYETCGFVRGKRCCGPGGRTRGG